MTPNGPIAAMVRSASLLSALLVFTHPGASAQDVTFVPDMPTCAECSIDLVPTVVLGGINDPVGVGFSAQVTVSSAGVYATSSPTFPGEIAIYDEAGRFQQLIGGRGDGPGEFSSDVRLSFDGEDSLHVMSRRGSRYSVFAPSFEHARSHTLQGMAADFCIGVDGALFVAGPYLGDGVVSHANVYDRFGNVVRSMGGAPMETMNPAEGLYVAACADSEYWGGAVAAYLVTRFNETGSERRDLKAERDWFPTPRAAPAGSAPVAAASGAQLRSRPKISGLLPHRDGRLLVFLSVPDADFEGVPSSPAEQLDTIVEVVDVTSGDLLFRQRFDEALAPIAGGGVFSIIDAGAGDLRVQVWDLSVSLP